MPSSLLIIILSFPLNKLIPSFYLFENDRKIVELEEELRVVGNNLKSLEVSEEKVSTLRFFLLF